MMKCFGLLVAMAAMLPESESNFLPDFNGQQEYSIYSLRVNALHRLLSTECPELARSKRDLQDDLRLEVEKLIYSRLLAKLEECRNKKATTKPPTTPSELGEMTTAYPSECIAAINFTEPQRLDHNGSDLRLSSNGAHNYLGYACDIHRDMTWFRFTGDAGNKMLNSCPRTKSCGTDIPLWTDDPMPDRVGVTSFITAYGVSRGGNCRWSTKIIKVMRCSYDTDYDFIYKPPESSLEGYCYTGFCGMVQM